MTWSAPPRWLGSAVLFLVVALGYVAWRAPGDLVWDDSLAVCENVDPDSGTCLDTFDDPHFFAAIWTRDFGGLHVDGYRPLNWAVRRLGSAYYHDTASAGHGLTVFNGVLAGLLAVSFYRLARRFTPTRGGALLAVFLLLASTPVLTGFLVLFAGIQALVALTMCLTLNCYFAALESQRPWPWLLIMGLLLLVVPWYREFAGLTSVLVLFLEVQRGRWHSGISLLAVLTFLSALFPTALPHFLLFPDLPVRPVYQLGALEAQMRTAVQSEGAFSAHGWNLLRSLKWRIFLDMLSILPPTLFLLATAGWVWTAFRHRAPAIPWRHTSFLSFFFLLTFLPFLKVFKEQVHLAYCLVPACILLAASVNVLWRTAALTGTGSRVVFGGLLLVAGSDHALNLIVVRGATRECYAAIDRVAAYCAREMPAGSCLVCNAHQGIDVQLRCGRRFVCYFSTMTAANRPRLIDSPDTLQALVQQAADAGVFCLDVRLPRRKSQRGANRVHWVVRDRPVDLHDFGEIDRLSYCFPVLDPLKFILPQRNMAWPCSPDLEFDYYRGPALDRSPWMREVAVSYHFSKVVGREVRGLSGVATKLANQPATQDRAAVFK